MVPAEPLRPVNPSLGMMPAHVAMAVVPGLKSDFLMATETALLLESLSVTWKVLSAAKSPKIV